MFLLLDIILATQRFTQADIANKELEFTGEELLEIKMKGHCFRRQTQTNPIEIPANPLKITFNKQNIKQNDSLSPKDLVRVDVNLGKLDKKEKAREVDILEATKNREILPDLLLDVSYESSSEQSVINSEKFSDSSLESSSKESSNTKKVLFYIGDSSTSNIEFIDTINFALNSNK